MASPQHLPSTAFLRMGSAESQGSVKGCLGFYETKTFNGGRFLLVVLNLYVGIKVLVATFNTNHSVTYVTQTITCCCILKLPDPVVESVRRARHRHSRYGRRDCQLSYRFVVGR